MGPSPVVPVGEKVLIVMSVLAGEFSIVQAARKEGVSEQSITRWNAGPSSSTSEQVWLQCRATLDRQSHRSLKAADESITFSRGPGSR